MKHDLILVVDDDPAIVEALQMILDLEGFTTEGYSGTKVLQKISAVQPDLLLLDVWLAGEDGRKICQTLKSDSLTATLPVILISASRDLSETAASVAADDFIEKPFDMDDVITKVKRLLEPQ
jgi:DNA-binding response OmpR family regulator